MPKAHTVTVRWPWIDLATRPASVEIYTNAESVMLVDPETGVVVYETPSDARALARTARFALRHGLKTSVHSSTPEV